MWGLERAVDYNSSPVIGRIAHVRQGRRVGAGMAPVVASSEIRAACAGMPLLDDCGHFNLDHQLGHHEA
jgi:hypothetical protein